MFDNRKYWDERLKEQYNLLGVGYGDLSINYNKWSYKVTEKILFKLFKKYGGGNGAKVLDIGSGTGFVVSIWDRLGKSVTGIDISKTAVENLSKIYPRHKFVEFDVGSGKVDLSDNSYDCISSASVLYHIVDDKALDTALANVHRLLKKDGIFIFSDNFLKNGESFVMEHQKCRSLEDYKKLLAKNNLEIISKIPNYVLLNHPINDSGLFYKRIWMRATGYSKRSKFFDSMIWRLLYPIELLLVNIKKETPAQEFMICKAVK
jgi:SAM-dependent methyltransferase